MNSQMKRLTALGTIAAIGGVGAAAALSQPSGPSETASLLEIGTLASGGLDALGSFNNTAASGQMLPRRRAT